ncbi:MAG: riboflavin synthase subunit alpha [Candidatus Melainabacteria bacterium GWF2_37_15]|nr:MAG: riboflavin synthase subunit alpha [Candidatus Melainabacteria bacterium GWF2_37_15]
MFTGLIEETGTVAGIKKQNNGAVIVINCTKILDDLKPGDSVAIDGACQTVTKLTSSGFEVEASRETLDLTILNDYKQGQVVNLERAMSASSRFGGHIVTGHVEGMGNFLRKENQGLSYNFYFTAPQNIMKYAIYKGSITVNGISLTVASLENDIFSVAVIPTTLKETNLGSLNPGDMVNLEPDVLAKYVEKFTRKNSSNITENYLEEHGFL